MVAVSARVPRHEAEAFTEYVRRKGIEATGNPDAFSVSAVLRGLMREAVEREPAEGVRSTKKSRKP